MLILASSGVGAMCYVLGSCCNSKMTPCQNRDETLSWLNRVRSDYFQYVKSNIRDTSDFNGWSVLDNLDWLQKRDQNGQLIQELCEAIQDKNSPDDFIRMVHEYMIRKSIMSGRYHDASLLLSCCCPSRIGSTSVECGVVLNSRDPGDALVVFLDAFDQSPSRDNKTLLLSCISRMLGSQFSHAVLGELTSDKVRSWYSNNKNVLYVNQKYCPNMDAWELLALDDRDKDCLVCAGE